MRVCHQFSILDRGAFRRARLSQALDLFRYTGAMNIRYEPDEWTPDGPKILSDENLEIIRKTLENEGPIIVEHWFYRGSRSPDRFVFEELDDFVEYVHSKARPGDAFHVWSFYLICTDEKVIAHGKHPDRDGRVPKKGAY